MDLRFVAMYVVNEVLGTYSVEDEGMDGCPCKTDTQQRSTGSKQKVKVLCVLNCHEMRVQMQPRDSGSS
jgi:hypothetical protein